MSSTRRKWAWRIAPLALALLAVGGYGLFARAGGAARPASPAAPPRPTPVVLAPVRTRDVGVYITGLGAVTPLNTVTVHTRVDGQLLSVQFREGQLVSAGDLLAEIDRALRGAADAVRGPARLAIRRCWTTRASISRATRRWSKTDAIPEQQLDTQRSLVRQDEGAVKNDRARSRASKVQLAYCRITSPITGRVGLRLVDPGNIVHAADAGGLVVITQLQPIAVIFTIPEDSIPDGARAHRARDAGCRWTPTTASSGASSRSGTLLTIDNQVDPTTGTVRSRRTFPEHRRPALPEPVRQRAPPARRQARRDGGARRRPSSAAPAAPFVYVVTARPDGRRPPGHRRGRPTVTTCRSSGGCRSASRSSSTAPSGFATERPSSCGHGP